MENSKTIRISIISVLSYLIFIQFFNFLSTILFWTNLKLQIELDLILVFFILIIGAMSLFILNFLFNNYLKEVKTKSIYLLLLILILLIIITGGITYIMPEFMENKGIENYKKFYLYSNDWYNAAKAILPFLALILFLRKMK